jgi:hypothetical protein
MEKPEFICLSEHWMKEIVISIPGYVIGDSYCRKKHRNGGVFVKSALVFSNMSHLVDNLNSELLFECGAVKYTIASNDFIVLSVYRSPVGCFNGFLENLDNLLYTLTNQMSRPTIILAGDFNCNLLKDGHDKKQFLQMLQSYYMKPMVNTPTRVTAGTETLLDNIFSDYNEVNTNTTVFDPALSDHSAIVSIFHVHE